MLLRIGPEPRTAPELARHLGVAPDYLRWLIREHHLMPGHRRCTRYALEEDDVARIAGHPAVRMAVAGRRERRGEELWAEF